MKSPRFKTLLLFSILAAILSSPGSNRAQAQGTELIPKSSSGWRYLANGSNQGTAWRELSFNDSSWPTGTGPIGYGDGGLNTTLSTPSNPKPITMYFRHYFTVNDLQDAEALQLEIRRDDGAVVYLNGAEVFRTAMPNGTINFNTTANVTAGGTDETRYFSTVLVGDILTDNLVQGQNVIAVEVHQTGTTSSDSHMDLSLTSNPPEFGVIGANTAILFEDVTFGGVANNGAESFERFFEEDTEYEWTSPYTGSGSEGGEHGAFFDAPFVGDLLPSTEWSVFDSQSRLESEHIDLRNYVNVKVTFDARTVVDPGVLFTNNDYLRMGVAISNDGLDFTTELLAADLSGGLSSGSIQTNLVTGNTEKTSRVPVNNSENTANPNWRQYAFNDFSWNFGFSGGTGFEGSPASATSYSNLIGDGLDVASQMRGRNATVYLRAVFEAPNPATIDSLVLRMKYDDGFIAYINGTEVTRSNADGLVPTWNSSATAQNGDTNAVVFEDFNITAHKNLLNQGGQNVLAIHGLNISPGSSDMVIYPELIAFAAAPPPLPPENLNQMTTEFGGGLFTWEIDVPDTTQSMILFADARNTGFNRWIFADNFRVTGTPLTADNYFNWVLLESDYDIGEPEGMGGGDGDGDGVPNFVEYGGGGDPMVTSLYAPSGAPLLPRAQIVDGGGGTNYYQMTYRQLNLSRSGSIEDGGYIVRDIQYIPQISVDGFDWREGSPGGPLVAEEISMTDNGDGTVDVTVQFTGFPLIDEDEAFVRLKIIEVAP